MRMKKRLNEIGKQAKKNTGKPTKSKKAESGIAGIDLRPEKGQRDSFKKTTITLPPELLKAAKKEAVERDIDLSHLIRIALAEILKDG